MVIVPREILLEDEDGRDLSVSRINPAVDQSYEAVVMIPYFINFQNPIGDDLIVVTGDEVVGFTRTVVIPDTVDFVDPPGNNVNINNAQ